MRVDPLGVMVEGLFLGIAFLIIWLFLVDRKSKQPWEKEETWLLAVALGIALVGAGVWVG